MSISSWRFRRKNSSPSTPRQRGGRPSRAALSRFMLEGLEARSLLSTITWINPKGGDWNTGSNWKGGVVPGPNDDAVISIAGITVTHHSSVADSVNSLSSMAAISIDAGSLSLESSSRIANTLSVAGGNFSTSGPVSLNSLLWSVGTMSGTGTVTVIPGGTTTLRTNNARLLDGLTFDNLGSATWTGSGNLEMADGAVWNNMVRATFNDRGTGAIIATSGASPGFNNAGTFEVTAPSTGVSVEVPFANTGTILARTGSMTFDSGMTTTGQTAISAGYTVEFNGDQVAFGDGASFTGAGLTWLTNGATITTTGASKVSNFAMDSGTLTGAGTLTATGMFTWTGGTMSGSGTTDAQGGMSIGGYRASEYLDQRTLINSGLATFDNYDHAYGAEPLFVSSGAVIDNLPGATFDIVDDCGIGNNGGTPVGGTFINDGTLEKTAGTAGSSIQLTLIDTGIIQGLSGSLYFQAGGTLSGTSTTSAASGAMVDFNGGSFTAVPGSNLFGAGTIGFSGATFAENGTFNVSGGTEIDGGSVTFSGPATTGILYQDGGTLTGAGTFTVSGPTTWTGGTMSGSGVTDAQGGMSIGGYRASEYLDQRTLINGGLATFDNYDHAYGAEPLFVSSGAVIDNLPGATFDIVDDCGIGNNGGTPVGGTFINDGTLEKTAGTAGSSIQLFVINTGLITGKSGSLLLQDGGSSTGSAVFDASGGALIFAGNSEFFLGGQTAITGDGVSIQGAIVSVDGSVSATNLEFDSGTLTGGGTLTTVNFDWAGGLMTGSGQTTITNTLSLPGNPERDVVGRTLNTNGTVDITTAGLIGVSQGGSWNNGGTFNWEGAGNLQFTSATFSNSGTMNLAGSGTVSLASSSWVNSGTLTLNNPSAVQLSTSTWSNSGTETLNGSGTVDLESSNWSNTAIETLQGTGSVVVNNASTWSNTGDLTVTAAGPIDVSGSTWSNAGTESLVGTGVIQIGGGGFWTNAASFNWSGSDPIELDQSEWTNSGTMTWSGVGSLSIADGSVISNASSGSLMVTNDQGIPAGTGTAASSFENAGSFTEMGASGVLMIALPWSNTGTMTVKSGTLSFTGDGSSASATFDVLAGASIDFLAGTDSIGDGTSFTGAGLTVVTGATVSIDGGVSAINVEIDLGTIAGAGTLTVANLAANGGQINGTATITVTGTFMAGASAFIGGDTLINDGLATVVGSAILDLQNGATFINNGTLDLSDQATLGVFMGSTLTNLGTVNWSGSSSVDVFDSGSTFNNPGTLNWTGDGTLQVSSGALSNTGLISWTGVGMLAASGAATVSLDGTFDWTGAGDFSALSSQVMTGGTFDWSGSGTFTADQSATVTLNGTVDWSGTGNLDILTATLANAGMLNWAGSGNLSIGDRVTNSGELDWTGTGTITLSDAASLVNQAGGTIDDANNGNIDFGGSSQSVFENDGLFVKLAASGASTIETEFNNNGTVQVSDGSLYLESGVGQGSFDIASGASIDFATLSSGSNDPRSYSLAAGATFTGAGVAKLIGSTISVDGNATMNNLEVSGGTLTGAADLGITGRFTWSGGAIGGTGIINIAPGASLDLAGGSDYTGLRTINNEGTNSSSNAANVFVSTDQSFSDLSRFFADKLAKLQAYLDNTTFNNAVPLLGKQLGSSNIAQFFTGLESNLTSPVAGTHVLAIQQGLYELLGPDGAGLLVDNQNLPGIDQGGVYVVNSGGSLTFEVTLQVTNSGNLGFTLGLPGVPFSFNDASSVQTSLGLELDVKFGVSQLAGQAPSVFVAPSTATVAFNAGIPGMSIGGKIGFLQASIADDPSNPTSFGGSYDINFSATEADGLVASSTLTAAANVNLLVTTSFGGGVFNPKLSFDFNMGWNFTNADTSQTLFGQAPTLAFNKVELDLGSFFGSFLSPLITEVQTVTKPLEPLAQFLTVQVPLLTDVSEALTQPPIYLTDLIGDPSLAQDMVNFANAIVAINGLTAPSGSGVINLGSFTLADPRSNGAGTAPTMATDNAATDASQQIDNVSPTDGGFLSSLSSLGDASGFDFPILDNPTNAFDLLLGINATLFTYTMPTVTLSQTVDKVIPTPIPGLEVAFTGTLGISLSATFGFGTEGFIDGNPDDGFFVQNAIASVSMALGAGPATGIPGGVAVTITGNVTGTVNFELAGADGTTVYGSQLESGNYTIDTSGSIVGSVDLEIDVLDPAGDVLYTLVDQKWANYVIYTW